MDITKVATHNGSTSLAGAITGVVRKYGRAIPKEKTMESTIEEMAEVLRSTGTMAAQFADRVQERVGEPVPHDDILAVMKTMSQKTLSMDKVVTKLRRQLEEPS